MDILDFEAFDAVAAGEIWAVEYPKAADDSVRILINGKDIQEHCGVLGKLGHAGAGQIYNVITELCNTGAEWSEYGAELGCCMDCGIPGCDYIRMDKREEEDRVYWRVRYEYDVNSPKLTFCFEKEAYEKAMAKLKELAES